jgi:carbon monoxide dehydrogenase subunit G
VHCNYSINIGKMIMKKRNQITQAAVLAVATMSSVGAMAETASVQASVTVDNSIDFTATGALGFGTLRALGDNTGANCSYLTLTANPATATLQTSGGTATTTACGNAGTSAMLAIGGTLERPVFTLAGLPGFTTLQVTLPTTVDLTAPVGPTAAKFTLRDFTAWKTSGVAGAVTTSIVTGAVGTNTTFLLGATLATDNTAFAGANYQDSVPYTGNVDVIVTF